MKCAKCGTEVPEHTKTCPNCGAAVKSAASASAATAVRPKTVPQRPHAAYPDTRRDRRAREEEKEARTRVVTEEAPARAPARKKTRPGARKTRRVVILVLLLLLAGVLLWLGLSRGERFMDSLRQEPAEDSALRTSESGTADAETAEPDGAESEDAEPASVTSYDITGFWTWETDTATLPETVWQFAPDGSLLITYFGEGRPEALYDAWPDSYTYDEETATLTLAGEELPLIWKNEKAFYLESEVLGACDARRTDEAHIPTGAVDIRRAEDRTEETTGTDTETAEAAETYFFADSDSRYLKKSECQALTADELRIARNEIYARHGRRFDSADLQAYFDAQDWYEGTTSPEKFNYKILNAYEKYNVNLMKSVEDAKRK